MLALPPLGLLFAPLREQSMHFGVDGCPWWIIQADVWDTADPAQGVELVKHTFDILPVQPAHGAVAALNVAVGQYRELARKDVARHRGEPIMLVRQHIDRGVKRQTMRQKESVKIEGHATG